MTKPKHMDTVSSIPLKALEAISEITALVGEPYHTFAPKQKEHDFWLVAWGCEHQDVALSWTETDLRVSLGEECDEHFTYLLVGYCAMHDIKMGGNPGEVGDVEIGYMQAKGTA